MSLVSPLLWKLWMGDRPMPQNCTFEMMGVMYDAIKSIEDREYAAEQVKFYERLFRQWLPEYKHLQETYSLSDNVLMPEEWETIKKIMKLLKEQILYWREELTK